MNNLKDYILEKFQITKDSKLLYTCHPKDKYELRKILEERLAKDKDADLNDIDVSKITDMGCWGFPSNNGLFQNLDPHNIKIDLWDMSNVEDICNMFRYCKNFNCNLGNWNVSNVKNMAGMFCRNFNFTGNGLDKWNVFNVKNMNSMFDGCINFNCNLSNWKVSNVNDMDYMFNRCELFTGEGLKRWNVSNVKNMFAMFANCKKLNVDLNNWKVLDCCDTSCAFVDCTSLKNKPSWYKN